MTFKPTRLLPLALPLLASLLCASARAEGSPCADSARAVPQRSASAPSAPEFLARISAMSETERDAEIKSEILSGNMPNFLRNALPESFSARAADGTPMRLTLCVLSDYLSVGSDKSFIRMPMALDTALTIAARFGFSLPTRRIVDMIHSQAKVRLTPQPLPAGDKMRSTPYYARHNELVQRQRAELGGADGQLTAGHKKDIVLSPKLWQQPGQEAIYGWHKPDGKPIQPLSSVHGMRYADYSHGVRLVSETVYLNGEPRNIYEILADKHLAPLLSDEGPLPLAPAGTSASASAETASASAAAGVIRVASRQ